MKRQQFIQVISVSALGVVAAGAGWVSLRGSLRVRPVHLETCGKSFLAFCERARFATAEEAVQVTARRGQPFELFLAGDDPQTLPPAEVLRPRAAPAPAAEGGPPAPLAAPSPDGRALEALKTAQLRIERSRHGHASVSPNMNRSSVAVG